jgi:hypothetical protein
MNIGITSAAPPLSADDMRRAFKLNQRLLDAMPLAKAGWDVVVTARGVRGRRGPAFAAKKGRAA